jgi:hypothetical protein
MKESVTRLRISGLTPPAMIPGAIAYERGEGAAVVTARGDAGALVEDLRLRGYTVDVLGAPSLEEIFVETQR